MLNRGPTPNVMHVLKVNGLRLLVDENRNATIV